MCRQQIKIIALLIVVFACTAGNIFSQTITFNHKGSSRTCIVHLPPSYNASNTYPVVFLLHGAGINGLLQQAYSGMDAVADTAGFIVAYPDAISGMWDVVFSNSPIDDAGFISILLDSLIGRYNIDTTRVYSCGMSMGGFMTYRLGCELADRLAAIASVTGPSTDSVLILCSNSRIIPVMQIHGTADGTVPYEGDSLFNHIDSTIAFFVNKNGCGAPVVYDFPDINTSDGCTVTSYYYCMDGDSAEVLFYKVFGGEHTWPGATTPIGVTNQDINGSAEIWKFFRKHQRNTAATAVSAASQNLLRVFPNPVEDALHVVMPESISAKQAHVEILDMTGRMHRSFHTPPQTDMVIDLNALPQGVYAVRIVAGAIVRQAVFSAK